MIIQNLKVAFRNLMKYKVQTLLSIASIAIGIVTLSLAFSVMTRFRLPSIMSQPFKDRAYEVILTSIESGDTVNISKDALRAIKGNGGLRHAEQIAAINESFRYSPIKFHFLDSTIYHGSIGYQFVDPEYILYAGLRSAITDKPLLRLKKGEALISEKLAHHFFHDANPVGAILASSNVYQPFPETTIVDLYKETSYFDPHNFLYPHLLYCTEENIEDYNQGFLVEALFVVIKEGSTDRELITELNGRVKTLGLQAIIKKVLDKQEIRRIVGVHFLVYLLSSLLLLAAIIGFLRMQIQLFWMRRREISLRIVNGAKRIQLFLLLITEVLITLLLSVILSVILGNLQEDFLSRNLDMFRYYRVTIENLWQYSLWISAILFLICCTVAWLIIELVCSEQKGLVKNMRLSRNHLFRNVMLGIQIAICIVFVSLTFILINAGKRIFDAYNVPENDVLYRGCTIIRALNYIPKQFFEEVDSLPELDKNVSWLYDFNQIKEVQYKDDKKFWYPSSMDFICTPDTSLISTLGMEVEWLNRDLDRNNCLLIGEDYYKMFKEDGILENGTLTYEALYNINNRQMCLPIGGIIKKIPYKMASELFVAISPVYNENQYKYKTSQGIHYLLFPKPGKEKALARKVNEIFENYDPGRIDTVGNNPIQNYRNEQNENIDTVETVTTLGWILGIVSVIICSMSILSTIMLDTRSRRKEVAIRKINGAKSIDIYRLFGRVYIILLVLAVIVAIPVCVMFNGFVENYVKEYSIVEGFSPLWPIVLGISIVAVLILTIVGWQTHKMLRIDPAKIIAKE